MRDRIIGLLAGALEHLKLAPGSDLKRHAVPTGAGKRRSYTGQWWTA